SESLQNHSLVVEYTSNPSWYAVQALPYLIEYPYECAEQTWNRYYANSLAMMISNSSPRVKQIFEQWKTTDSSALLSNLQKNAELVKHKYDLKTYVPGHFIVQYLYMRSFFPEYKMPAASQAAYDYFRTRAQKTWTQQSKYMQGMLVLALGRTGDAVTPAAMLK